MSLLARLAAFSANAKSGPVKINIHAPETPGVPSRSPARFVLYAALVAGGFMSAVATMQPAEPDYQAPTEQGSMADDETIEPQLKYVEVNYRGKTVMALDANSRIRLVKDAAREQDLDQEDLNWKDLYGVIHAETAWVARDGKGKNGVTSSGLAQLEPNTAKALNIKDPNNPASAVKAAAALMKEAAAWSRAKIRSIPKKDRAAKLREGVSIYYNLSTRGRNQWNGHNTADMPIETRVHITNVKDGARIAHQMGLKLDKDGEQQRANFQQGPSRAQTLKVQYSGALSGDLSLSDKLKDLVTKNQFDQELKAGAELIKGLLDTSCPTDEPFWAKNKGQNACVVHYFGQKSSDQVLPLLKEHSATMLGTYKGSAVLLIPDTAGLGAAMLLDRKKTIVLDAGLLRLMAGPDIKDTLKFVLAHEHGHLSLNHLMDNQNISHEIDADEHAIQTLVNDGMDLGTAQRAVDAFTSGCLPILTERADIRDDLITRHKVLTDSIQARVDQQKPIRQAMR